MPSSNAARSVSAFAASLVLHAGAGAMIAFAFVRATPRPAPHRDRPDTWAGNTLDVEALFAPGSGSRAAHAPAKKAPRPKPARSAPLSAPLHVSHAAHAAPAHVARSAPSPWARARSTSPPSASSAARSAPASSAAFGAAGVPASLRDLGKAFTRALPRAAVGDPLWSTLPLGRAGSADVVVRIDSGRLVSAKPKRPPVPPQIDHLLVRTALLLKAGQFALSESDATSGSETLRIELTISAGPPSGEFGADPTDAVALGFRAPRPGHPGLAYFTLASGRHVEARVTLEPAASVEE